jgi:hypothetical protein
VEGNEAPEGVTAALILGFCHFVRMEFLQPLEQLGGVSSVM